MASKTKSHINYSDELQFHRINPHTSITPTMESMDLFDDRYKLIEMLGEGSYGAIYSATDTQINRTVALKIARYSLAQEAKVYELLNRNPSPIGIPRMVKYVNEPIEYIVMEKLGKSIRHYWINCRKQFSLKTVVTIGIQMISRLESIHSCGMVHGDVKDDNFVFDEQCQTLYIIDFGLSRPYIEACGIHIPEERDDRVIGTLFYSSINTHNKIRLSRRDDLESTAYMLIRLLKGALPWELNILQGANFTERFHEIGQIKKNTIVDSLCEGVPEQFKQFLVNVRRLGFKERPDYSHLQRLLRSVLLDQTVNDDGVYDWMLK